MRRWASIVVGLYGLLLLALMMPAILAAFYPMAVRGLWSVLSAGGFWISLMLLMLCQAALLVVPVKVASQRPVSRRALLWPFFASGFFLLLLVLGAYSSVHETWEHGRTVDSSTEKLWLCAGWLLVILTWLSWAMVFRRMARNLAEKDLLSKTCRLLLKGSILELLVAVPTHVLARSRDYCCAGFGTFAGISCGIAVMLASFGPGVFWLYVERWKRLHPEGSGASPQPPTTDASPRVSS